MPKKIWLFIMDSSRYNSLVGCAILGIVFTFSVSAFGQTADYAVNPGDTIYISVWGDEKISGVTTVGPDGTIVLPLPVGSVYVSQMTADQIAEVLTRKLEEYVKQPIVSVSIRSFQGFVVHVLGHVMVPSFYQIPEGTSLQEVITKAGGFTDLADSSSIILIRKADEKVETQIVDFSRFLEQTEMESNPVLQAGDVVVVPGMDIDERMSKLVNVAGEVVKPGSHELDEPISLLDILALSGGSSRSADLKNILILNRSGEGEDAYRQIDMEVVFSKMNDPSVPIPMVSPGETVFVPNLDVFERPERSINVAGQVIRPGAYPIAEDVRLIDAIFLAGGFAQEASIDDIAVIRAEDDDSSTASLYSLRRYFVEGDMSVNPVLKNKDTVVVPTLKTARSISPVQMAFSPSISVSVIGAVAKPGAYQMPDNSNLLEALTQAGGPTVDADLKRAMLIRAERSETEQRTLVNLEEVVVEGKLELLPIMSTGDIVLIPKEKPKRDVWRIVVTAARDMTVILGLVYYFERLR